MSTVVKSTKEIIGAILSNKFSLQETFMDGFDKKLVLMAYVDLKIEDGPLTMANNLADLIEGTAVFQKARAASEYSIKKLEEQVKELLPYKTHYEVEMKLRHGEKNSGI